MEIVEFNALFDHFERSAFRVEARDRYDVDDERGEFAAFLEGKNFPPRTAESDPWLALVAGGKAVGRLIERVRLVGEPLTEYTRFEFTGYRENIAAGEKVRVVPRTALADADQGWASEDFWIFDEELVVLLSYDDEGRFLGVHQAGESHPYLAAKQRALSLAVDFEDFVAEFKL
jgi:hypothetical protein